MPKIIKKDKHNRKFALFLVITLIVVVSFSMNLTAISNFLKGNKTIAIVIADQVETFKGGTSNKSTPDCNYLPKGTIDYCGSKEIISYSRGKADRYRLLGYGHRVNAESDKALKSIKIVKGSLPDYNRIKINSIKIEQRHTVLTLDVDWKAPFLVEYLPQQYQKINETYPRPDFTINQATFEFIDITFPYASMAAGGADFSSNPLLNSMEWIKSQKGFKLRLHLRKKGMFYGFSANYNEYNQLVFKFLNPAVVAKSDNEFGYILNDAVVMLDPGHGGSDCGAVGLNENLKESQLNLMLALEVKKELEAINAKVILTRTDNHYLSLAQRTSIIRGQLPDIFISIHRNASINTAAKGYDNYYFYPFSKQLADCLFDEATKVLSKRKVNYYPFYVTRVTECPAVLTENGFISNPSELQNLIKLDFNKEIAKSTVQGIVNYFVSLQ